MVEKDTQSNKFLLTINNPQDHGLTHEVIVNTFVSNFKTVDYVCMSDEKGSCFHTHVFAHFQSRVRFSTVKKHFPQAHIDVCRGLTSENIQYVAKTGKWQDTDKSETRIEGSFEEFGNRPSDSRGTRHDMTELYNMVADGMTNADILAVNQDYILQLDKLDKLRTTLLIEKFKEVIRTDLKCVYIYGKTGTGKTTGILKKHGARNVYRVTDYMHPFDGYACQPVICFDEFRASLRLKEMLNYCDIFPIELPARFSNKFACYDTVYIVSNWELERQYADEQQYDPESWAAFLRRIHEVHVYNSREDIRIYHSVVEYMNRDKGFQSLTDKQKTPFDE